MDPDLRDLLAAWQGEEDPGEERRATLLARLRHDETFHRSFLDEIRLVGLLKVAQSSEPRWLRLELEYSPTPVGVMPTSQSAQTYPLPFAALLPLLWFSLTLFVSAALLFLVQPMIGKMLLPMLGGTPAVWNTCMVFFQALLLAGYAYAHAANAWLGVRRQALVHLGVLLLPFFTLGLTVDRGVLDYGQSNPILGLLLVLLLSVGLPFFVVSASAPLLQKWFAGTGHPAAQDPYFLYGASNLGSMLALFGYPTVIEPWLTLAEQRRLWQVGYIMLVVLTAVCIICLWWSRNTGKETGRQGDKEAEPLAAASPSPVSLSSRQRLRWVASAFVPSSLMLGVTTYLTTDIAAIPLLWVLPLGLYLLSFILVFSRLPALVHRVMVVLLPLLMLLLVFLMLSELSLPVWWKILAHLAVLFVAAMVCHGELARDRPPTRYLTEFYLWMSVGGVLGGLFNALIAPVLFHGIVEYPLALVLACLLLPTLEEEKSRLGPVLGTLLMGVLLGGGLALLLAAMSRSDLDIKELAGSDGLWLGAISLAALVLVRGYAAEKRDDRVVRWLDLGLPAALGVLAVGLNLALPIKAMQRGMDQLFTHFHAVLPSWIPTQLANLLDLDSTSLLVLFLFILPVGLCYLFIKRPLRFGLGLGALLLANAFCDLLDGNILLRQRSFFGVLRVDNTGLYRRLKHGTTLHGLQRLRWDPATLVAGAAAPLAASAPLSAVALVTVAQETLLRPGREPETYYHRTGPIGQVFTAYQDRLAGRDVGLVGLGSGTLASYGQPGQRLTYYEIDPLVKHIAHNRAYFTLVREALDRGVKVDVVLGDARLKLEERTRQGPPEKFALLVIDAFSWDAIPMHLLTREALAIYFDNLADDGLLAFHISNRHLDLEPVLGNLAAEAGLAGFIQKDWDNNIPGKTGSTWVILGRKESALDRLLHEQRWKQWQSECGWAIRMLSAFPDASGSVHAQAAVYLTLLEHLRAPWCWASIVARSAARSHRSCSACSRLASSTGSIRSDGIVEATDLPRNNLLFFEQIGHHLSPVPLNQQKGKAWRADGRGRRSQT